ncbi:MAG: hypothetical protein KDD59_11310 [Bdellovibrionales bacterium]|nr:hypothetical protein [Bdellovibrionales bacterium]
MHHQETFTGLLVPFFRPWLRSNVVDGFHNMDQGLKIFCELTDPDQKALA